jgi:hypothetical protein
LELDANALYGALLTIKTDAGDPDTLACWTAPGGRAFSRESRIDDEGKEAIVIAFDRPVPRVTAAALLAAGFRFNKLLRLWEGRAHFAQADALAATYGGRISRVDHHNGVTPAAAASGAYTSEITSS